MEEFARNERLFPLDIEKVASHARTWTSIMVDHFLDDRGENARITHGMLEDQDKTSGKPQDKSSLTSFNLFMRHVALWELGEDGEIECVFRVG